MRLVPRLRTKLQLLLLVESSFFMIGLAILFTLVSLVQPFWAFSRAVGVNRDIGHRDLYSRRFLGIRGAVAGSDVVLGSRPRMVAPPRRGRPGSGRGRAALPEKPPGHGSKCDRVAVRSVGRTIAAESSNSVRRMSVRQRDGTPSWRCRGGPTPMRGMG